MAWVNPDTTISLYRNVPLSPTYEHTIWWESEQARDDYFARTVAVHHRLIIYNCTYQRNTRNIRVPINQQDIIDYNYLRYNNRAYGDKYFYGFILDTVYINDNCTEIVWQMDVLTSYMFDFEIGCCWVEREHSATDEIGANLVPEGVDVSNYMIQSAKTAEMNNYVDGTSGTDWIVLYSSAHLDGDDANPQITNRVLSGLANLYVPVNDAGITILQNFIDTITSGGKSDALVGGYQVPAKLYDMCVNAKNTEVTVQVNRPTSFSGYIPKNNKLFTYPYCFVRVGAFNSSTSDYRFEYANTLDKGNGRITFMLKGVLMPTPEVVTYPYHYGLAGNLIVDNDDTTFQDYTERVTISDFVPFCWTIDSFAAWLSQQPFGIIYDKKGPMAAKAYAALAVGGQLLAAAGNAVANATAYLTPTGGIKPSMAISGLRSVENTAGQVGNQVFNTIYDGVKAMRDADQVHNFSNATATATSLKENDFHYYTMSLRATEAEIVDNYFTMFGYATQCLKVPNTCSRQRWNYIKTTNCNLDVYTDDEDAPSVPADVQNEIESIFNGGITLFHDYEYIGKYDQYDDNPCTGLEGFRHKTS